MNQPFLAEAFPTLIAVATEDGPGIPRLLGVLAAAIILLLTLILYFRMQAYVSLLLVSVFVAIGAGMDLTTIGPVIVEGMGSSLGQLATIVGLGSIFGQVLQHSGGAKSLAHALHNGFGEKRSPLAMILVGFLVSIPVFFDVGLVILAPILVALSKNSGKSILYYGLPLCAAMAVTHACIPPTPGPILVGQNLDVSLGNMIIYGGMVALPTALIAGLISARMGAKMYIAPPQIFEDPDEDSNKKPVAAFEVIVLILLPIGLILAGTIVQQNFSKNIDSVTDYLEKENAEYTLQVAAAADELPEAIKDETERVVGIAQAADGLHFRIFDRNKAVVADMPAADVAKIKGNVGREDAVATQLAEIEALLPATPENTLEIVTKTRAVLDLTKSKQAVKDAGSDRKSAISKVLIEEAGTGTKILVFLGHPITALLLTTIVTLFMLGTLRGTDKNKLMELSSKALGPAGIIILVTGAGGVFKTILVKTQVGDAIAATLGGIPLFLLAFVLTFIIRVAQGSATVAMIGGSALMASAVAASGMGEADRALIGVAIACAATMVSHVNDSGFWVVKNYLGMTEKQTLQTFTVITTIIGLTGFTLAWILSTIF
ncbi:MAG: H+/gluconate symporter-like permease [Verrucomicrobiales bacterium]|jgi:H+/gluconate symporter-like permease